MNKNKFEQEKYNELRRSICIEFRFSKKPSIHKILTEAKGMVDGNDVYINTIMDWIDTKTCSGDIQGNIGIELGKEYFKGIEPFFNKIILYIDYQNSQKQDITAMYNSTVHKIVEGKIDTVEIKIVLRGNYRNLRYELPRYLTHEILHAYENWKRTLKTGKTINDAARELGYFGNTKTRHIANQTQNHVMSVLGHLYYACTSFEKNAYTAQLKQTLKDYKRTINNADDAMTVIQYTHIYQGFIMLGNQLNDIIANKEQCKEDIEDWYESTFAKTDLSYNKILKRLRNLYNKTWLKMRKAIASYVRYLYEQQ